MNVLYEDEGGMRSASKVQRDHPNYGRNKRSNFQTYDRFHRHLCSVVSRPADRMHALGRMSVRRFTNGACANKLLAVNDKNTFEKSGTYQTDAAHKACKDLRPQ